MCTHTFTIFDFETTGLYPFSGDAVCEIGAVKTDEYGARLSAFQSLVNPGRPISYGAFRVNGITPEMVRGKPKIADLLPQFLDFIRGTYLVAYNARFDLSFLLAALDDEYRAIADMRIIDALNLARGVFPGIGRYSLGTVAAALDIRTAGAHRALADAQMAAEIFARECAILRERGAIDFDAISRPVESFMIERAPDPDQSGIFAHISEALTRGRPVGISYRSSQSDTATERIITPKHIRHSYGKMYLVAYCHMRKEDRNFRVDCITDVRPVDDGEQLIG